MSQTVITHKSKAGNASPTSPADSDTALPEKSAATSKDSGVGEKDLSQQYNSHDPTIDSTDEEDVIIVTGADAAAHLLPLRDDGDPALTFRSLFLSSGLACFAAVMYQIYQVLSPR